MNENEKLLNDVREYLNSDDCNKITEELQAYLNTKDLTKLTMLEPKYLLSIEDIMKIKNNELNVSDLDIDTTIRMEAWMTHGDGDEKESTSEISLENFAKYSLEMIEYVRENIDNEDFELRDCEDEFDDLFDLPDMNYDKPHDLDQSYYSDSLEGIGMYKALQYWILDDILNRWR